MFWKSLKSEVTRLFRADAPREYGAPPQVERRPGSWHHADLEWMAGRVAELAGDFAEIGVFRGAAFRKLAQLAHRQNKLAHAFDSFSGMAEPSVHDGAQYPPGKFDIGGPEQFVKLMNEAGVPRDYYRLWPGYIPACFENVPAAQRFSLAILDVDHYQPTVDGLEWLQGRIVAGGILALDDYLESHTILATKAIKEFLARQPAFEILASFNQQLILKKR
jgi:macrocin-O-methyltransferase TylF-like protien